MHEIVDERRWLQLGLGGDDENNGNEPNLVRTLVSSTCRDLTLRYHAVSGRRPAIQDVDLMQYEDNLAVAVENQIEDDNCKAFMQRLGQLCRTSGPLSSCRP